MQESNIDRLLNYEQGERIIGKLQDIAGNVAMNIPIPVPVMTEFDYDGTPKTLQFTNLNVERTIVIDGTATDGGIYTCKVYLKNSNDKWFDGTTAAKEYVWHIYDTSWAYAADETIVELVAAADAGECDLHDDYGWSVGDERVVHLNAILADSYNYAHAAQDVTLVLMDTDHYELKTPVTSGSNCHFVVGFKECLAESEMMETSATNANGWHNSRGRKCCDAIFDGMIPSSLQPIFKQFKVKTSSNGNNTSITTYEDGKLALFGGKEITGDDASGQSIEAPVLSQIAYYAVSANRCKVTTGGTAVTWWLRSPSINYGSGFRCMSVSGGGSEDQAKVPKYFAPFGVI